MTIVLLVVAVIAVALAVAGVWLMQHAEAEESDVPRSGILVDRD
jgi:hypothetical protein